MTKIISQRLDVANVVHDVGNANFLRKLILQPYQRRLLSLYKHFKDPKEIQPQDLSAEEAVKNLRHKIDSDQCLGVHRIINEHLQALLSKEDLQHLERVISLEPIKGGEFSLSLSSNE